jgi:hypothetical protein
VSLGLGDLRLIKLLAPIMGLLYVGIDKGSSENRLSVEAYRVVRC